MDGDTSPAGCRRPCRTFKDKLSGFGPGDHLCCLYESDIERRDILTPYIRQGLERNEKVLCIMEAGNAERIYETLRNDGLDPVSYIASDRLAVLSSDEYYLSEGMFDPDAMIDLLEYETQKAIAQGCSALRVIGEMTWALRGNPGSDRLIEYEAKLNRFFPGSSCMALCQYDTRQFDAKILLKVLMIHPVVVIGTTVYDNGHYVPPDVFFETDSDRTTLKYWIRSLEVNRRYEQELEKMVEERTREIQKANERLVRHTEELRRTDQLLKLNERRLEALLALSEARSECSDKLAEAALEESVRLTSSEIGFINFLSEDEKAVIHAIYTGETRKHCGLPVNLGAFRIADCGLWSEALRRRRPIVVNDYPADHPGKRGLPAKHVPIARFLSIPLFEGDRIVAVAALGNKERRYDDSDVRQFKLFMQGLWNILQRKRAEDLLMVREKTARSMLNAITESVLLLDPQGTIADINETAAQRLHGTPAGMIGTSAYDYIAADTAEVRKGYVNHVLRTGKAVRFQDIRNNHIIDNSLCPVFDENGKVVQIAVFGRDVTLERQAEEALKESKNQLRHLSVQLIEAQEKERRRIAVELHDELGQALMVLKLQLRSAYNRCGQDPDAAKAVVHDALRYIDEITDRIRWLSRELSPAGLEDLGLAAAVGRLAEESTRHTATAIFKEIDEIRENIPYERQIIGFRIFQEALTNALKHAQTRKIWLKIKKNADALHCVIEDCGRGFVMPGGQDAGSSNGGLGLTIMRERARMLGGRLDIRTRPGAGTRIAFTVPLEKGDD